MVVGLLVREVVEGMGKCMVGGLLGFSIEHGGRGYYGWECRFLVMLW